MDQLFPEVSEKEWVKVEQSVLKAGIPCIVDKQNPTPSKELVVPLLEQKTVTWDELERMCTCSKKVTNEPAATLALARDGLDVTYCIIKSGIHMFPTITDASELPSSMK